MASSGFQADVKALQKVLSARHLMSLNTLSGAELYNYAFYGLYKFIFICVVELLTFTVSNQAGLEAAVEAATAFLNKEKAKVKVKVYSCSFLINSLWYDVKEKAKLNPSFEF
ncbi:hypothetical protein SESBI_02966 [Sesbania bispinosa]|nr:hypothetical protein SESBI_02966 [Sesbania bispinosa]